MTRWQLERAVYHLLLILAACGAVLFGLCFG